MVYTLFEVKKKLNRFYSVDKVVISIEEYGDGYDTYIMAYYHNIELNRDFETYMIGEEEAYSKAYERANRAFESLNEVYNTKYEGLANC